MSKIQKWQSVKQSHEGLVKDVRCWLKDAGAFGPFYAATNSQHVLECAMQVIKASRQHLFECLLEVSRERVVNAAREALADANQIQVDAAADIEAIEEDGQ
jgi:hypothetical protein